jgi:hypothetical protein
VEPIVLIHGYSAESKRSGPEDVEKIYGTLPKDLTAVPGGGEVVPINISRYVSLEDGMNLEDITLAFDRVLRSRFPGLLDTGFNAIVHSTGALVIRNWVRRFSPIANPGPVRRILYLAGANFGSGWAHIGESQFVKWARFIGQSGAERGLAVLSALELGSNWTLDLHRHFLQEGSEIQKDYGVLEFCIVGSQVPAQWMVLPFRYGKEDGSDGVVRVAGCNLNFNYLRVGPRGIPQDWPAAQRDARAISNRVGTRTANTFDASGFAGGYYEVKEDKRPDDGVQGELTRKRPKVPLSIPYQCAHSSDDVGIVYGTETRAEVLPLIRRALACTAADYADAAREFQERTDETYRRVAAPDHSAGLFDRLNRAFRRILNNPEGQYDKHAQVVIRVRDQYGNPVDDYSCHFNSFGGEGQPQQLIDRAFEDNHRNSKSANTLTFYLRTDCWNSDTRTWEPRLPAVKGVDLEIDSVDAETNLILYMPMRMRILPEELLQWIQPHRTTVVDVELIRLPSNDAFIMY